MYTGVYTGWGVQEVCTGVCTAVHAPALPLLHRFYSFTPLLPLCLAQRGCFMEKRKRSKGSAWTTNKEMSTRSPYSALLSTLLSVALIAHGAPGYLNNKINKTHGTRLTVPHTRLETCVWNCQRLPCCAAPFYLFYYSGCQERPLTYAVIINK